MEPTPNFTVLRFTATTQKYYSTSWRTLEKGYEVILPTGYAELLLEDFPKDFEFVQYKAELGPNEIVGSCLGDNEVHESLSEDVIEVSNLDGTKESETEESETEESETEESETEESETEESETEESETEESETEESETEATPRRGRPRKNPE